MKDINDGSACFMVIAQEKKKSAKKHIIGISMVDDYANVFSDDIPSFLPSIEVDFTIDFWCRELF